MSHLLRIAPPDVPGSLGAVASALGLAGGNIEAIEIVEHRADGVAIDDVFVELAPGVMPDMLVSAVQRLDDVRVLWVSRYAAAGNLHLDLEAVEVITSDPARAIESLTDVVPHTFRSDWALTASVDAGELTVQHATPGAPDLGAACLEWFPVTQAGHPAVPTSWGTTMAAVAPVGSPSRAIVFGRRGGPEILSSELARLNHLAGLAASVEVIAESAP